MKYNFNAVKKEFMKINTVAEWDEIRKKYPDFMVSDMDHEMKMHFNKVLRTMAPQEQIDNPNIHYEVKKK